MRVFLTGATGFIGSAIIPELLAAGHQVLGLTRSDAGAQALTAAGAQPHPGSLEDLESLRTGASAADAVLHCGFNHDFSKFAENGQIDARAIEAIGAVLAGSDRPFLVSSGLALGATAPGSLLTEAMEAPKETPFPRKSEQVAMTLLDRGVNVGIMRLPQVHDPVKQGLVPYLTAVARQKGVSAYVNEGQTRFAAAHISDVAKLYVLAMENNQPGTKIHAIDEEGVPSREIAEALARGLQVPTRSITPEEAAEHFGFLGFFMNHDLIGSSTITRKRLGWNPTGPGLIADLDAMDYSQV